MSLPQLPHWANHAKLISSPLQRQVDAYFLSPIHVHSCSSASTTTTRDNKHGDRLSLSSSMCAPIVRHYPQSC